NGSRLDPLLSAYDHGSTPARGNSRRGGDGSRLAAGLQLAHRGLGVGSGQDADPAGSGISGCRNRRRSTGRRRGAWGRARMSEAGVIALIAFGLLVVVVRRRSVAIAAVSLQSILLGFGAFGHVGGSSTGLIVAGSGLILKGVLLPLVLARTVQGARERRPIT